MAARRTGLATLTDHEHVLGARVERAEDLEERPWVQRLWLDDGRTVVRKTPRPDERAPFAEEAWALRAVGGHRSAPALLHAGEDVLVLEDLPPGRSLAESLLGSDPDRARADLLAYARALGELGAWSLGRTFGGPAPRSWWVDSLARGRRRFASLLGRDGVEDELDEVAALVDGGAFAGFVHGDPCPDNVRITEDGRCRVFDFERSSGGSIALDAAYLVAPFPSCWCFSPLPEDIAADALAAYESALPSLDRSSWRRAVDAAVTCITASRGRLLERAEAEDSDWGITTMRPRLLVWFDRCARQTSFPVIAAGAAEVGDRLRAAWPDVVVPSYPAFAGRAG